MKLSEFWLIDGELDGVRSFWAYTFWEDRRINTSRAIRRYLRLIDTIEVAMA